MKDIWQELNSVEQLKTLKETSKENPVLIFKHSTRCSISRTALDRLERNWKPSEVASMKPFYLDLLRHPDVSRLVSDDFNVPHESPQVLLICDGISVYDRSHFEIDYKDILKTAASISAFKN
jgi:bacillithiol system protein YtxJ